jgi:hypothetical protein
MKGNGGLQADQRRKFEKKQWPSSLVKSSHLNVIPMFLILGFLLDYGPSQLWVGQIRYPCCSSKLIKGC